MVKLRLAPIEEQVVVITGATSGLGLAIAEGAARRGAALALLARNTSELERIAGVLERRGARGVLQLPADVSDAGAVARAASATVRRFGRIDTWVNAAGLGMYGRLEDVELEDARRLFDVVFWGAVHGSRAALPHLRRAGGALINVASVLSERAVPLQGPYVAAAHALKAFTDALHLEEEEGGARVSVTLVQLGAMDTPFFDHAYSALGVEPQPLRPVYDPELVARVVLSTAEHRRKRATVGLGAKAWVWAEKVAPELTDRVMTRRLFAAQRGAPLAAHPGALWRPPEREGAMHGRRVEKPVRRSPQVWAQLHPMAALGVVLGGLGLSALLLPRPRRALLAWAR